MIHLIVFLLHGLFLKDIHDLRDIQNPVPQLSDMRKLAHLFIHGRQLVNQAGDFRIHSLQPADLFILNPPQNRNRIILYHLYPQFMKSDFPIQPFLLSESVRKRRQSTEPIIIAHHNSGTAVQINAFFSPICKS